MAYIESTSGAQFSLLQAITGTNTAVNSTNVFDVTGAGAGNAPAMIGAGGVNTAMGIDIGAGQGPSEAIVQVNVTTTGTGAAGNTISVSLQAAPDNGSYSPGTYTTIYTSAAFQGSTLVAGNVLTFPVPPIAPNEALPRFYRLVYTIVGTVTVTLTSNLLINAPLVRDATLYGSNFVSV